MRVNTMKTRMWAMIAAIVVVTAGCREREAPQEERGTPRVPVTVAAVRIGPIARVLRLTGRTQVLRQENIAAPIAGVIVSLRVLEGARVSEGDTLAVVRTRESQAAIDGARAARSRAQGAARTAAERALALAERNATDVALRASFAGAVASRLVNAGELVTENAPMFTIVDPASITMLADVPAANLGVMTPNTHALIAFPSLPGQQFAAHVANIAPAVDPSSQLAHVRLLFDDPPAALRGELFGEVRVVAASRPRAVIVPKAAVMWDNETGVATIAVVKDSLAHIIIVTTGIVDTSNVEIVAPPLDAGTSVIIEGNHGLADSTRVRISNLPERGAP